MEYIYFSLPLILSCRSLGLFTKSCFNERCCNLYFKKGRRNLTSQDLKNYITCLVCTMLIFILDINLSLGIAAGVPYATVILITLWATKQNSAIYFAVICSIMVVLGYIISPPGGEMWKVLMNRALAIFAIWVTAILVLQWQAHNREIVAIKKRVYKDKEEIYLATIKSSQHIINNLLNQLQYIKRVIEPHPVFNTQNAALLDDILEEGALLMVKLSSVENISKESIERSVHPGNTNV